MSGGSYRHLYSAAGDVADLAAKRYVMQEMAEPPGAAVYLVCGECNHVYRTARELRRAYRSEYRSICPRWWASPAMLWRLLTIRAGQIAFCQHCIHDF